MPFLLIKGEFTPSAGRPDGDSIRFKPDNPDPLYRLTRRGSAPSINSKNGTIQLRFEGIDTMESRAAKPYSSNATAANLKLCGVPNGDENAKGYILSTQIGPNGRPISFVFAGETDAKDGSSVFLDTTELKKSVNYKLIAEGHAYPLFYDKLFYDLRQELSDAAKKARESGKNVWSADVTNSGAKYSGPDSLETMPPIFPKLWRRLDKYSRNPDVNNDSLDDFLDYLDSIREERILILSQRKMTGFDDIMKIEGNRILLTAQPEDLVVVSI